VIDKVVSSLINMDIVSIYKQPKDKDMLIYLSDSGELFNSAKYQGYLRNTETSLFF
jgi:glucan phosphoethanolaminetransferase (alkaline phosphatase superfamily)